MTVRSIEGSNVHSKLSVNNVSAIDRFQPLAPWFYSPSHRVCFFTVSAKNFRIQAGSRCSDGSQQLTKLPKGAHLLFVPALS